MKKPCVKLLSVILILAILLVSFSACGDAHHECGSTPAPSVPEKNEGSNGENDPPLTSIEDKIKKAYCEYFSLNHQWANDMTPDQIYSLDIVSDIDGVYAFFATVYGVEFADATSYDRVAGIVFEYGNANRMNIYSGGKVYSVTDAYENGAVSYDGLVAIYKQYYEGRLRGKAICNATMDEIFDDNEIIVTLNKYFCYDDYSLSNFEEYGCVEMTSGTYKAYKLAPGATRILKLTLSEHSKENVLDVIKKLEERDDVYKAEPLYRAIDLSLEAIEPGELSEAKKSEIKEAFKSFDTLKGNFEWYGDESPTGLNPLKMVRYYGEYNGCIVLYRGDMGPDFEYVTVAGERMEYERGSKIWVYRNGEFLSLSQAHDGGLLSELDVSIIAEYHRRFQKIAYAADKADQ
jgi:hypothetical protein